MATNSYPAVGMNGLTDDQWSTMYGGSDGIIEDYTGASLALYRMNSTDQCRVAAGKVSVNGFVLDVPDYEYLYCAPVPLGAATVTYYIAAQYDPALNVAKPDGNRSDGGPCRLIISTNLDTSGGKSYVVLYRLVRSATQLLADTARTDYRRWIGPTVEGQSYIEDTVTGYGPYPRGTMFMMRDTGDILYRTTQGGEGTGLGWRLLLGDALTPLQTPPSLIANDTLAAYYRVGRTIFMQGTVKRSSGSPLNNGADVILATLPTNDRPLGVQRFLCPVSSGNNDAARVSIYASGQVVMANTGGSAFSWIDLSPITFRART